jgi:peptidoglycan/xylan/chitin deacetylase (PgdA/CDA1 family)
MINLLPYKIPGIIQRTFPGCVWTGDPGAVYLTFDDGPIPGLTEYVLEVLARYDARATFFCVGANVLKHPHIFRKLVDAGHAVGNHTHNHLNGWKSDTGTYVRNVSLCNDALGEHGKSRLFRPPYGRISRAQYDILSRQYRIVMWTVLTQDYSATHSAERSLEKCLGAVAPGSVVVFHDNLKAGKKLHYMLPRFIEACLDRGYRLTYMA